MPRTPTFAVGFSPEAAALDQLRHVYQRLHPGAADVSAQLYNAPRLPRQV